jgi:hypothetical protein
MGCKSAFHYALLPAVDVEHASMQVLQPAAEAVPLTQLSLNAFKENKDGYRALRIGIDAR